MQQYTNKKKGKAAELGVCEGIQEVELLRPFGLIAACLRAKIRKRRIKLLLHLFFFAISAVQMRDIRIKKTSEMIKKSTFCCMSKDK